MPTSIWPVIHAERKSLLADLEPLADDKWSTQSLCSGWTVLEATGHMIASARMTPPQFILGLAKAGFRFEKMSASDIARETEGGPKRTLERFREIVTSTSHPPGPGDTWLGEAIVHSADIRRPLGIDHSYPTDSVVQVANFFKGSNLLIGSKKRIAGLALRANDADWTTGSGPEVSGPILSLVLAMTGRTAAIDDLNGDGVAQLRSRG